MKRIGMTAAASALLLASSAISAPGGQTSAEGVPYAVRGIRLGISLAEFRGMRQADDENSSAPVELCTGDKMPKGVTDPLVAYPDTMVGVTTCEMYSFSNVGLDRPPLRLGEGWARPNYDFIDDGDTRRLFRVRLVGKGMDYDAVRDALTRNYGKPVESAHAFQVKNGATFPNTESAWSNGVSKIFLEERCAVVDRFCLTYTHDRLTKIYDERIEARAAAAAKDI